jgi:hypothetical protein
LAGAPDRVTWFSCWDNPLETLEGLPLAEEYDFWWTQFSWIGYDKEFPKLVAFGKEFDLRWDEILCMCEQNPDKDSMMRLFSEDRKKFVETLKSFYKIIEKNV